MHIQKIVITLYHNNKQIFIKMKTTYLSTKEMQRINNLIDTKTYFGTTQTKIIGFATFQQHHTKESLKEYLIRYFTDRNKPHKETTGITD